MRRSTKPVLAVLAGLVVVFASACGSSSATPTSAAAMSGAPSAGASMAGPTVNPNDPNSIITNAMSGVSDVKSFHFEVALSGTIKAAALQSADSPIPITSDLALDGTSLSGDVDVANGAAHLAASLPALPELGGVPITADVIAVNQAIYYKVSLLGTKYSVFDLSSLSSLTSGLPIPSALPTAGPSALSSAMDQLEQIRQQLQDAGFTAQLVGVDQIGGQDANHIQITIPIDYINQQIAAESSPDPAPGQLDSASLDFWVYKADNRLAKLEMKAASSTVGNLDLVVTITNYDQPVTISAPPASEVETSAP
jgi:hypothetical protein